MQRGRRIAGAPPKKRARVLVAGLTALLISPMTLVLAAPVSLADDSMTTETASPAATPSPNDKGAGSDKATDSPKATDPSPANTAVDKPKQDSTDGQKVKAVTKSVSFDWNWQYAAPTCKAGLVVAYPDDIPAGSDNKDVNIKVKDLASGTVKTFNFHDSDFKTSGKTVTYDVTKHPDWFDSTWYEYLWTQVHGTNYHWEGSVVCGEQPPSDDTDSKKVELCHATESDSNPYTDITVSVAAFFNAGHIDHGGDIWAKFSYTKNGKTYTVEAQGDQSILANGCVKPKPKEQYALVLWKVDESQKPYTSGMPLWPQDYVKSVIPVDTKPTATTIKDAFPDELKGDQKCVAYQGDGYKYTTSSDKAKVDGLVSGGVLTDYADSSIYIAHAYYVNSDCSTPPVYVVPDKPTKVDLCEPAVGPSPDGVNIPEADEGHYTLDGKAVSAGFNAVAATSAKVVFVPDEGAAIAEGAESEWTYTFTKEKCYVPPTNQCTAGQGDLSTNVNPTWVNVDTRANGHYAYVSGGLHVWTTDNSSQAKVSLGHAANFDLKNTGVLDLNWTGSTPPPGINLFVNFDGTHTGTLVYESVYGQDLWLTNGSSQYVKDNAPVNGGGNGSQWHGTINQWLEKFPDAKVTGIAFSLGSGVLGDGVIKSITVNCGTYTFDVVKPTLSLVATDQTCVPSNEQGHEGSPVYTGGTLVVKPDTAKVFKSDDIDGTALSSLTDVAPGSYTAVLSWQNGTETMTVQSDAVTVSAAKDCTVLPPAPKVVPKQESKDDCNGHYLKTWDEVSYPVWEDGAWTFDGVTPKIENVKESTTPLTNDEWWTLGCYPEQPPALSEHQVDKKANCDGNYETSWDLVSTFAWVWFEGEQWSPTNRGEWVAQQPVVENFKDWHWVSALNSDQKKELKCSSGPHNGISPNVPWGPVGALAVLAVGSAWFAWRRRHSGLQG